MLVTTTESPPPASGTLAEVVPALTETVPVGRKGVTDPVAITVSPRPLTDVLDHHRTLKGSVGGGRDRGGTGRSVGWRAVAAHPIPRLGDDLL
jgi:hypothetical protein